MSVDLRNRVVRVHSGRGAGRAVGSVPAGVCGRSRAHVCTPAPSGAVRGAGRGRGPARGAQAAAAFPAPWAPGSAGSTAWAGAVMRAGRFVFQMKNITINVPRGSSGPKALAKPPSEELRVSANQKHVGVISLEILQAGEPQAAGLGSRRPGFAKPQSATPWGGRCRPAASGQPSAGSPLAAEVL